MNAKCNLKKFQTEFNSYLGGHQFGGTKGIYNHEVLVNADAFLPFDEEYLPCGSIQSVSDHAFEQCTDFRTYKRLGDVMHRCPGEEFQGYVLPFVLNKTDQDMT